MFLLFFSLADISYPQLTGPYPQLNQSIYNQIVTWTEFTILAMFFSLISHVLSLPDLVALASPEPELPTLHLDLSVDPLEVKDFTSDYDDCDHDNDDNDDKMQMLHLDLSVDPSASDYDDYVGPQDNFLREKS